MKTSKATCANGFLNFQGSSIQGMLEECKIVAFSFLRKYCIGNVEIQGGFTWPIDVMEIEPFMCPSSDGNHGMNKVLVTLGLYIELEGL